MPKLATYNSRGLRSGARDHCVRVTQNACNSHALLEMVTICDLRYEKRKAPFRPA
jgi:hypothetical protein